MPIWCILSLFYIAIGSAVLHKSLKIKNKTRHKANRINGLCNFAN